MQFDGFLRTDTRNRVSGPVGVASKRVEAPSTQEKPTSSMSANHPPSALIGAPPDPKSSPTCPIDTCPPPSDHGVPSEPIAAVVPTGDRASEAPKINENTNNDKKRSQPPRAAAVRYTLSGLLTNGRRAGPLRGPNWGVVHRARSTPPPLVLMC